MKKSRIIMAIFIMSIMILICLGIRFYRVSRLLPEMFRLNAKLQSEGYYMGEFEFKMLGIAYWLDKGQYGTALSKLEQFHQQLLTRSGLIKVPRFPDKEAELRFYLGFQNPRTGAFMDDAYPYCTYNEVTENVLAHLDVLATETGQPLRLKYPLKYLDQINTPKKLKAFLDDVSKVGWIASRFPQTTFVFARSLLSYYNGEGVIRQNKLYDFSPEWKQALLQWFYENQDPRTGFWGAKSRTNDKLWRKDLNNTASIIKTFIDRNGNNIQRSFPLRYKKEMFKTALEVMFEPMPADANLDEWHEWELKMGKGISMLTRYLWKDASPGDKVRAKELMAGFVKLSFEKNYIAKEGAFSYYPDSKYATLDGTGGKIGEFADMGFFSAEKQKYLWGNPEGRLIDLGTHVVSRLTVNDMAKIISHPEINALRFYSSDPDFGDPLSGVVAVAYPAKTPVLDIMDFTPKVKQWLDTTSQSMGNWVSKETTIRELDSLNLKKATVYTDEIPLEIINQSLKKKMQIVVIGFDVFQAPRYKIIFKLLSKRN
jgi:hypothetical protein